jgi:hypothetical protein
MDIKGSSHEAAPTPSRALGAATSMITDSFGSYAAKLPVIMRLGARTRWDGLAWGADGLAWGADGLAWGADGLAWGADGLGWVGAGWVKG